MQRIIPLLSLIAFLFLHSCGSTKKISCERYRTGRFQFHSELDNSTSIIERSDSIQTETNLLTGNIIKARIKWTSDCEYDLEYISNSSNSVHSYIKSHVLKTVILESKKDYYIFKSSMEGIQSTLVDTIKIMKQL